MYDDERGELCTGYLIGQCLVEPLSKTFSVFHLAKYIACTDYFSYTEQEKMEHSFDGTPELISFGTV